MRRFVIKLRQIKNNAVTTGYLVAAVLVVLTLFPIAIFRWLRNR